MTVKDLCLNCFKVIVKVLKLKVLAIKGAKVIKASLSYFKPFKEESNMDSTGHVR